uniref:BLOC-1-related complex subunit 6 isoform X2 n=1 Tax=Myxine glutinosa TaxID=7769 RepID=UPI00358DDDB8
MMRALARRWQQQQQPKVRIRPREAPWARHADPPTRGVRMECGVFKHDVGAPCSREVQELDFSHPDLQNNNLGFDRNSDHLDGVWSRQTSGSGTQSQRTFDVQRSDGQCQNSLDSRNAGSVSRGDLVDTTLMAERGNLPEMESLPSTNDTFSTGTNFAESMLEKDDCSLLCAGNDDALPLTMENEQLESVKSSVINSFEHLVMSDEKSRDLQDNTKTTFSDNERPINDCSKSASDLVKSGVENGADPDFSDESVVQISSRASCSRGQSAPQKQSFLPDEENVLHNDRSLLSEDTCMDFTPCIEDKNSVRASTVTGHNSLGPRKPRINPFNYLQDKDLSQDVCENHFGDAADDAVARGAAPQAPGLSPQHVFAQVQVGNATRREPRPSRWLQDSRSLDGISQLYMSKDIKPKELKQEGRRATIASSLELEGTVVQEGNLTHFVAADLQEKIKLSSSKHLNDSRTSLEVSSSFQRSADIPAIDPSVLVDLEIQAKEVASNVDNMMKSLNSAIQSMTALSVGYVQTYRDSVDSLGESVDFSIKAMYTLIARTEELDQAMRPVHSLTKQIKEVKRLLDYFETLCK